MNPYELVFKKQLNKEMGKEMYKCADHKKRVAKKYNKMLLIALVRKSDQEIINSNLEEEKKEHK
jgi:hypothetical protein